jgi:hypothetical protein
MRDEPIVEDLGRSARAFTVQGFLLGPDYMDKRDALIRALEEPGPGLLVHPWYGEIMVSQSGFFQDRHSATDGGMCTVTMTFTRDSGESSPGFSVNQVLRALSRADIAKTLACAAFDTVFSYFGETAYVAQQTLNAVENSLRGSAASLGLDAPAGLENYMDLTVWPRPEARLSAGLWDAFQGLGGQAYAGETDAGTRLASGWVAVSMAAVSPATVPGPGYTRARIAANAAAVGALTRHVALIEASRSLVESVPESRSQARILSYAYQDALDSALLEESEYVFPGHIAPAPLLPDELYVAVSSLRASTLAALAQAARSAPDVTIWTPARVLPSLVLCYRLSGDIVLDADLVRRNHLAHPGFVPVEPLEVLTGCFNPHPAPSAG